MLLFTVVSCVTVRPTHEIRRGSLVLTRLRIIAIVISIFSFTSVFISLAEYAHSQGSSSPNFSSWFIHSLLSNDVISIAAMEVHLYNSVLSN